MAKERFDDEGCLQFLITHGSESPLLYHIEAVSYLGRAIGGPKVILGLHINAELALHLPTELPHPSQWRDVPSGDTLLVVFLREGELITLLLRVDVFIADNIELALDLELGNVLFLEYLHRGGGILTNEADHLVPGLEQLHPDLLDLLVDHPRHVVGVPLSLYLFLEYPNERLLSIHHVQIPFIDFDGRDLDRLFIILVS
mmetsp:Transcript_20646/g.19641  ORF Transcript_20646/g.19641 Transcript_20646/m.19641 type:complete len:200 (-) Transcript_20646:715-1314(-)